MKNRTVKKPVISTAEQRAAAEILICFAFVKSKEDFEKAWKDVYDRYELCDDPFTHLPCSCKDYAEYSLSYDKQTMMERYGHCDGVE